MERDNITLEIEERERDEVEDVKSDEEDFYGDSDDDTVPPPPPSESIQKSESKDDDDDEEDEEEDGDEVQEEALSVEGDEDEDILNFQRNMMENLEGDDDEYDDDSDLDEDYLQKLDTSLQKDIVTEFHPELLQHKNEEIEALSKVVKNDLDVIVDPFHKTVPFLTKFEKARILGERAKQLNAGGKPFVNVDASVIDGYLIAEKELEEKKIPFIIKRPLTNGGCEYWKIEDLEVLY
tara:strand:+ start:5277 stop:5984 length:708 start_codon:yes stop_codon:yes gene_type:complete